jgi:hypothetical protein
VEWSGRHLTPAGSGEKVETPQAKPRRLDFLPAESKCLERNGTDIIFNFTIYYLLKMKRDCPNSSINDFWDSLFFLYNYTYFLYINHFIKGKVILSKMFASQIA